MASRIEHLFLVEHTGSKTVHGRLLATGLAMAVVALVGLSGARVYSNYSQPSSEFDWSARGHSDFHNGTYFPSIAFRDGVNPYALEVMEKYPLAAPSRPCPPITFISHLPLTYLDLPAADVVFFIYNTSLLILLAFFAVIVSRGSFHLVAWLAVCCVLLVSRPGHITLFTGYITLELVLGTLIALHFARTRPWLSATGMLIASGKPTYVLPLILLMLARKNYRATLMGIALCAVFGIGGLMWLARDQGIETVISGVREGQAEFHNDETEFPINTWTRVDLLGMFAKTVNWVPDDSIYLAGMFVLLVVPCVVIHQITDRETDSGAASLTACISLITILIAIYHHSYDCLLIVVPWVGLTFFRPYVLPEMSKRWKTVLALLLTVPLLNYLSTQSFRDKLGFDQYEFTWQSITMINGLCLFVVLLILLAHAFHVAVKQTIQRDFGR